MKRRRFLLFAIGTTILSFKLCKSEQKNKQPMNDEYREMSLSELENEVRKRLNDGQKLTVDWNCGGDEAIVTVYENGEEIDYKSAFSHSLHLYIINILMLPDVGDFLLEGKGHIYNEEEKIYLECESIFAVSDDFYDDFEEQFGEEFEESDSGIDEEYSGKFELFDKAE